MCVCVCVCVCMCVTLTAKKVAHVHVWQIRISDLMCVCVCVCDPYSKESRTTLSKCVLGREVYIHCKRTNTTEDALQTLPAVEKFVRGGKGSGKDEDGSELHGLFL